MRRSRKVFLALLVTVIVACGDYEIPLRHGYILGRIRSDTFVVVDPAGRVVFGPTVDRCRVEGDLLAGHVSTDDGQQSYFILNMRTGNVRRGLNETDWRRELAKRGLEDHQLLRPARSLESREIQR